MSKMKELDSIATAMADHLDELIKDSIDWVVDGTIVSELKGDEYFEACSYITNKAIEKMAMELPEFRRVNIGDYKQNTITTG